MNLLLFAFLLQDVPKVTLDKTAPFDFQEVFFRKD